MFKHSKSGMVLGALCALMSLWMLPASMGAAPRTGGKQREKIAAGTGCRDGWRRVGSVHDPTLDRSWAVVESCRHPAWPARLEPASRWKPLPKWVPAGSRVRVTSRGAATMMRLEGRTLSPGRVGQKVMVRLRDGARVWVRLTATDRAEMVPVLHWRQR